jgi:hypothetical protein
MWVEETSPITSVSNEPTTMWVVVGYGEYIIYNNQEEAEEYSNELSYAVTEEQVQYNISKAEDEDYTLNAVEYLLELSSTDPQVKAWCNEGNLCIIFKQLYRDVAGLKDILGKGRWVEFIKQLYMGYSIHPARLG